MQDISCGGKDEFLLKNHLCLTVFPSVTFTPMGDKGKTLPLKNRHFYPLGVKVIDMV